jgi:hypothetical protein
VLMNVLCAAVSLEQHLNTLCAANKTFNSSNVPRAAIGNLDKAADRSVSDRCLSQQLRGSAQSWHAS